jgi:V/A-type H+-transporting ATPase subunit A
MALGGTALTAGAEGTGKTFLQRALAQCRGFDAVICVVCGERPCEASMEEFGAIAGRAAIVAAPSNASPVEREASFHLGMTLAEYYRDMGYDVALLLDSVSGWAGALREISACLGETGGGAYPAYFENRLARCYERAGRFGIGTRIPRYGSVSLVGTALAPGADFSDPVIQACLRLSGAFWKLDEASARARRFPALDRNESRSSYPSAQETLK